MTRKRWFMLCFVAGFISSLLEGCGPGETVVVQRPTKSRGSVAGQGLRSNQERVLSGQARAYAVAPAVYPLTTMEGYIPAAASAQFVGSEAVLGRIKNLVDNTPVSRVRCFIGSPSVPGVFTMDMAIYEIAGDGARLVVGTSVHQDVSAATGYADAEFVRPVILSAQKRYAVALMLNNDIDGMPVMDNAIFALNPTGCDTGIRGVETGGPFPSNPRFSASGFEVGSIGAIDNPILVLCQLFPAAEVATFL